MLRKYDGVFWADAAAGRAALAAVIRLLDEDRFDSIDAIDPEEAEVDALHAVGAAAIVDDGVPAAGRFVGSGNPEGSGLGIGDCGLPILQGRKIKIRMGFLGRAEGRIVRGLDV